MVFSAVAVMAGSAQAQFTYNSSDVLVCFRNVASPNYDLIVDAGPVSTFTNMAAGYQKHHCLHLLRSGKGRDQQCRLVCLRGYYNYPISDDTWLTRPRIEPEHSDQPLEHRHAQSYVRHCR